MHESANAIDGHRDELGEPSILDRTISLESLSWMSLGWVAVAIVGFLLRVANFSAWPLSASEGRLATDALSIVQGASVPATASTSPLPTALTALSLFLFGASDGIVRVVPLIAGLGTLALIGWLRPFAGRGATLTTALVVAISPTLVMASRHATDGGLLVFSMLLTFVVGLCWHRNRTTGLAVLFGIAAAMTVMSDPIGWIALPIVAAVVLLISDERTTPVRELPFVALGAGVTILVVSTNLFVHPAGFSDFFRESLRTLWNQHLTNAGADWHLAVFQLFIDEPLSILLAVSAVVLIWRWRREREETPVFAYGLILWVLLGLLFGSLLGDKGPALYTLTALPLALLAGLGLDMVISRVVWPDVITPRGAVFVVLIPVTFFAAVSTYGLLASDVGADALSWIVTFLLVAIVVFAPLLALTIWLRHAIDGWAELLLIFAVVLLAGIGIRSSVLLGDTVNSRAGEPLLVGVSQPPVGLTVNQIRAVSRDMTTFEQDVLDPTGGHGLTIVIDSSVQEPFAWYFRDFPNVQIQDPGNQISNTEEPQVLIARSDHGSMLESNTNRLQRTLPLESTAALSLTDPGFSQLIGDLFHPGRWQRYPEFLINRKVDLPTDPTHFIVSYRQDVVTQMYGSVPPSNP